MFGSESDLKNRKNPDEKERQKKEAHPKEN